MNAARILIVEDEARLAGLMADYLRAASYEVDRVHDGLAAIPALRAQAYDLVLLDLGLPDIPGSEVLRRLRADPRTATIPVVVVSADATPDRIGVLIDAGASHYLSKPFDIESLLGVVDSTIGNRIPMD